jgi:hypothetical protein
MQPFQQRVVDEKRELDEKSEKLLAFINGKIFQSLTSAEQERMHRQWQYMNGYSGVLGERIEAFE